jgi:hypothetical protein
VAKRTINQMDEILIFMPLAFKMMEVLSGSLFQIGTHLI